MNTRRICFAIALGMGAALASAATPKEQRAVVQTGIGGPEVLQLQTVPVPQPGKDQVLVKIHAAAINPADWKRRLGIAPFGPPASGFVPIIPGSEAAGIVEQVGDGVTQFKRGDPVFGLIRGASGLSGAYSEYAIAPVTMIATKPKNFTYEQAAGLGVAGYTALRALDSAKVGQGQRVFINGIAGGVGSITAQIAKARGAYVIGTASEKHREFLKSIGVDEIIDYKKVKFEEVVQQVDVVIDTVGTETSTRSLQILKKSGVLIAVTIGPSSQQCAAAEVNCPGLGATPSPARDSELMSELGKLADAGKIQVNVDAVLPLEKAADAQEENRNGGTTGKIIIDVDPTRAKSK